MLLDTSGLFCLHHRDEPQHKEACELYENAINRITHSYVLAEFVALTKARGLKREAVLSFAFDIIDSFEIEVVWIEEIYHRQGLLLLQKRLDKSYSLCDAVSFVLMRERKINEALTTDHHFEQEGFVRLLKP
jgi:predicted nucleic acid-binding protein